MKQVTILSENKPGVLAKIAGILGERGVNMESITAETFPDGAIIRIVTKDTKTAAEALKKTDYRVSESDILLVSMMDRAGELGKIARKLADNEINVENIYLLTRKGDKVTLAFKVNKHEEASKLLKDYLEG